MRTGHEPLDAASVADEPRRDREAQGSFPDAASPDAASPDAVSRDAVPGPERKRVRSRLLAVVLVSVAAVLAVGTPGVVTAAGDLNESQRLAQLAELNGRAVTLAHSLADERDQMTRFMAEGRSTASGAGISEDQRGRVDRQAGEVRAGAADVQAEDAPAVARQTGHVRELLAKLPTLRQHALSGPGSPKASFDAYSELIDGLGGLGATIARELPARAADLDTTALPALTRAVDHASAARGLLVAALGGGGAQDALVAAAQQSEVRERAALTEFDSAASTDARDQYAETVTGKDVADAEALTRRLTDQPRLSGRDFSVRPDDLQAALTARIDRMRSVESSLAEATAEHLRQIRDDDVVALELCAALVGAGALLVLGLTVQVARSVVRPLGALHRAARRLNGHLLPRLEDYSSLVVEEPEPVSVAGRDEFRELAAAVSAVQAIAVRLHRERGALSADHTALIGVRNALAAEREALLHNQESLLAERAALQGRVHSTFVNLSMRTLTLVERQLALIERLEDHEQDPEQLESLFRLDHLATRMRRNSENLLVLAGIDAAGAAQRSPVPLLDVLRAAISEIERYDRVAIQFLPRTHITGLAADDVSHLLAELLENATAFSPPHAEVAVSGWVLENGEVMLAVEDHGIGIPGERLTELNDELGDHPAADGDSRSMGLFVVGRLSRRHGVRVQLREMKQGGVTAVVVLPRQLVVDSDELWAARAEAAGAALPQADPGTAALPSGGHEPETGGAAHGAGRQEQEPAPRGSSRRLDHIFPQHPPTEPEGMPPAALSGAPGGTPGVPPAPTAGGTSGGISDDEQHSRPEADVPAEAAVRPGGPREGDPAAGLQPAEPRPAEPRPAELQTAEAEGAPATRTADAPGSGAADPAPEQAGPGQAPEVRTPVGLPKRVPQANSLPGGPGGPSSQLRREATPVRPRSAGGGMDPQELRRRLGGFQQGLRDGRRDADAFVSKGSQDEEARG